MDNYLLFKSLHILGIVLFLGNIIITGWWKVMADKTKHPLIIAFAQRQVTLTDFVFTAGGAGLVLVTGLINAMNLNSDYLSIYWISKGYWMFIISGLIWALILIPVQIKQARMAKLFEEGKEIPELYWKLGRIWIFFGITATLIPLANLYFMVYKPL